MKRHAPNKEVFLQLLESNKGIIFKVCNMYCSDPEDQKDLVQEVIIQLWNSHEKFDGRSKLSTWIYRVALNVAISSYRKTKTKSKHIAAFEVDFLEIAEETPQENDEDLKLLKHFIDQLDELNKALIILYLDENNYEEIAAILNISPSNVGTKINRIKKRLKEQFETLEK